METQEQKAIALEALEKRKAANAPRVIDNASLPAGAPMYYYCHGCQALVATKPEGWFSDPPPKHCAECQLLVEQGLIE